MGWQLRARNWQLGLPQGVQKLVAKSAFYSTFSTTLCKYCTLLIAVLCSAVGREGGGVGAWWVEGPGTACALAYVYSM